MSKENPYLKDIREKVHNVYEALDKTLREDKNITFEEFNLKWSYNEFGCVYLDIDRLITWQFKDQIKKAYEWNAEQEAKVLKKFVDAADDDISAKLELQNKLHRAGKLYIHWDKVADYYTFNKPERKIIKKLKKLETVDYYKPAYGNCFGKIGGPDAVFVKGIKNGLKVGELLIPIEYIDLEKTFESK